MASPGGAARFSVKMRFLLPSWKGVGSAVLAVLGLALCAAERGTCLRRTPIDARPPSSCGLARGFLGKNSTAEGRLSRKAFFAVRGGESVQARVASAIPSAAFLGRSPRVPLEAAALGAGRLSSFSEESPAASPCKSRKMSGTPLAWRFAAASRGARSLRPCAVSCRLGGGGCFVPFAETQRRRLFSLGVGRSGEEGSRDRLSAAFSRTKQVATIGPASWDFEQVGKAVAQPPSLGESAPCVQSRSLGGFSLLRPRVCRSNRCFLTA